MLEKTIDIGSESMPTSVTVTIPTEWLLTLASQGTMGTGETPIKLQEWAEACCKEQGLGDELSEARRNYIILLKQRMVQVMGSQVAEDFEDVLRWGTDNA